MVISRFNKCSTNVELTLFKSFCMSVCMMWHSGSTSRLLFSISLDLAITNVSRNCLVFKDLIAFFDLCLPSCEVGPTLA